MPEPMPTPPEPSAPTCPTELPRCPKCDARSSPDHCGWRDFDCRSLMNHGKFCQSDYCTQRERDALAAQVAALRADVARLEGEHSTLKNKYDWLFQQNCELNHRVEVEDADVIQRLESALASSVPRSVAERACELAAEVGWQIGADTELGQYLADSEGPEISTSIESKNARERWEGTSGACVERAEAEHAAARQGKTSQPPTEANEKGSDT